MVEKFNFSIQYVTISTEYHIFSYFSNITDDQKIMIMISKVFWSKFHFKNILFISKVMTKLNHQGSVKEFFDNIRSDPSFLFQSGVRYICWIH